MVGNDRVGGSALSRRMIEAQAMNGTLSRLTVLPEAK
jgi:hypothetical protein